MCRIVIASLLLVPLLAAAPAAQSQSPTFTKSPADSAVIAAGWANAPVFMADPVVYTDAEGLHLRLSDARPGDRSFGLRGRTIFVVDDDLAQRLTGRKLDVKETQGGTKLSLGEPVEDTIEA